MQHTRPGSDEAAEYYFKYINLVPEGDISQTLESQGSETLAFLGSIPAERADFRYASDKWTVSDVMTHINDVERLFTMRALWFARGMESALPSFEPDLAVAHGAHAGRAWSTYAEEFAAIRASTVHFFRNLPDEAWQRRGVASGMTFSVRALAWIAAGHVLHHTSILRERYL